MKNTRSALPLGSSKNYHALGSAAWRVQELTKDSERLNFSTSRSILKNST